MNYKKAVIFLIAVMVFLFIGAKIADAKRPLITETRNGETVTLSEVVPVGHKFACPSPHLSTSDFCGIVVPKGKTLTLKVNVGYDYARLSERTLQNIVGYTIDDNGTPNDHSDDTRTPNDIPNAVDGIVTISGIQGYTKVVEKREGLNYMEDAILIYPKDGQAGFATHGDYSNRAEYIEMREAVQRELKKDTYDSQLVDCDGIFTTTADRNLCKKDRQTPGLIWLKEASTFIVQVHTEGDNNFSSRTEYYIHDNQSPFWKTSQTVNDVLVDRDRIEDRDEIEEDVQSTDQPPVNQAAFDYCIVREGDESKTIEKERADVNVCIEQYESCSLQVAQSYNGKEPPTLQQEEKEILACMSGTPVIQDPPTPKVGQQVMNEPTNNPVSTNAVSTNRRRTRCDEGCREKREERRLEQRAINCYKGKLHYCYEGWQEHLPSLEDLQV
ncbi:MAG: hypothetical protein F4X82_01765 [Candidatus Spechtbacteria bacterium SB0662_bin_43]|uniref:Uncharacterized protein n=1 Tax=Candidatus Spechtbacteria bacterium SB0662_bin_43 TaxID=2604897 RepID=A0A845D9U9_9BACT|nr:hypothetical protein [Candidatus Spechtbacteria bacterium SB0662_bin_43]